MRRWSRRGRVGASIALTVVAAIALLLGGFTLYLRQEVFDDHAFADRAQSALQRSAIRQAISDELVETAIRKGSTELLQAKPLVQTITEATLRTPAFGSVFRTAALQVHRLAFRRDESSDRPRPRRRGAGGGGCGPGHRAAGRQTHPARPRRPTDRLPQAPVGHEDAAGGRKGPRPRDRPAHRRAAAHGRGDRGGAQPPWRRDPRRRVRRGGGRDRLRRAALPPRQHRPRRDRGRRRELHPGGPRAVRRVLRRPEHVVPVGGRRRAGPRRCGDVGPSAGRGRQPRPARPRAAAAHADDARRPRGARRGDRGGEPVHRARPERVPEGDRDPGRRVRPVLRDERDPLRGHAPGRRDPARDRAAPAPRARSRPAPPCSSSPCSAAAWRSRSAAAARPSARSSAPTSTRPTATGSASSATAPWTRSRSRPPTTPCRRATTAASSSPPRWGR